MKNDIKNLFTLKKDDCKYFIEKDGHLRRFSKNLDTIYMNFLCLINNNLLFNRQFFPYLYGDETKVIKKLLIIKRLQDENVKYVLVRKREKNSSFPDYQIEIFKEENLRKYCICQFLYYYIQKYDSSFYYTYNPLTKSKENDIKYLSFSGVFTSLYRKNMTSNEILIVLFFNRYIKMIGNELIMEYGVNLKAFHNYHDLFMFLKEKGYVNLFFNKMGPKIIKGIPIIIDKVENHPLFPKYVNMIHKKEMKDLRDFSIEDLVDKFLPKSMNKEKILKKFNNERK